MRRRVGLNKRSLHCTNKPQGSCLSQADIMYTLKTMHKLPFNRTLAQRCKPREMQCDGRSLQLELMSMRACPSSCRALTQEWIWRQGLRRLTRARSMIQTFQAKPHFLIRIKIHQYPHNQNGMLSQYYMDAQQPVATPGNRDTILDFIDNYNTPVQFGQRGSFGSNAKPTLHSTMTSQGHSGGINSSSQQIFPARPANDYGQQGSQIYPN